MGACVNFPRVRMPTEAHLKPYHPWCPLMNTSLHIELVLQCSRIIIWYPFLPGTSLKFRHPTESAPSPSDQVSQILSQLRAPHSSSLKPSHAWSTNLFWQSFLFHNSANQIYQTPGRIPWPKLRKSNFK